MPAGRLMAGAGASRARQRRQFRASTNSARDTGDDRSRLRRRGLPHVLHLEVTVLDHDAHPLAAAHPAVEHQPGEPVVHLALDGPAERAGAELRFEPTLGEPADSLRDAGGGPMDVGEPVGP
jgi:hypothetical protein